MKQSWTSNRALPNSNIEYLMITVIVGNRTIVGNRKKGHSRLLNSIRISLVYIVLKNGTQSFFRKSKDELALRMEMTAGSCAFIVYANVPKVDDESICPVCDEPAPQNEVHHAHYGGISCYRYFAQVNVVSDAI